MKILIYGEYWDGTMADLLKVSLEKKGHDVQVFDFTKFLWRNRVAGIPGRALDRILWPQAAELVNREFIAAFEQCKPDAVLVSKGIHVFSKTLREMKAKGVLLSNWNPDDFLNPLNSSRHLRDAMKEYDYIFSPRPHLFAEYKALGAKECVVVDWYYDPVYHRKEDLPAEWQGVDCRADISFVGTWSRYREDVISALEGQQVKIWGAHWDKASKGFQRQFGVTNKVLPSIEMPRVILNSKINLNILTRENRDTTNLKLFEIPACGGLLLSERSPESLGILREKSEALYFGNGDELLSTCKNYLKDDRLRQEIAEAGYQKIVHGGNTLRDRSEEILKVWEGHGLS